MMPDASLRKPPNTLLVVASTVLIGYGVYSGLTKLVSMCDARMMRGWKKSAPLCEGPKEYRIMRMKAEGRLGNPVLGSFKAKAGETVSLDGARYDVIGHIDRPDDQALIVRKEGSDGFDIVGSGGPLSRFKNLRYGGWSCEKPGEKTGEKPSEKPDKSASSK
jgi:hypothetical protein